ncbi:hypothetical protein INR49_006167 [Caranx melampygus]|nr:hypothetical protein INR49_006167 [Caranx melampygus]
MKRCSCVSEPRITSIAEQTGHRARCHPENGGCAGTGGTFSLWGDGTWEGPTLQECARIFETLQTDYYEEYKTMGLADLAVAVVHPLLKEKLRSWDPLKDSSFCLEDIGQWRAILESRDLHSSAPDSNMDPYHRLLWEVWIPVMRSCVSSWQPRIVGPMVDCVDVWAPLIPMWIMDHLLEQLILPRLQREVDNWNPLTDTVPIHSWIHPWLPLLQSRLEPLYPPIRSKLSNALQRWHPSDTSARLILQPWKDVFTPELVINPHQQQMEPFHWVMDWEGMLSPSSLVSLLDKNFFTKWLQVLCSWLSNSPNYEEITKWYLGWKSMFSDVLLSQPLIKEKFNEALDIMNRAVSTGMGGYMQPGARENIAYLTQTERRKDFQYEAMQERRDAESVAHRGISAGVPTNFKDLIQTKAEENNIVFMPLVAKRHEGKQLYTFGRIVIYIDRGVVFVQGEKTWVPTGQCGSVTPVCVLTRQGFRPQSAFCDMSSEALKKRKSKVLRSEGGTPEMKRGRAEGDQQDVRVYSEEVELDGRDPEQDYQLYKESCESLATLMSEIQELKANGAKEGCAEVEQRRMQSCIHFMNLKKLNRLAHMRLKRGRDQTHEAKQKVDVLHLQLQNLLYEVMHLQKEISKCLEFKSKHEEIDLVSEDEFYQEAPQEISRPQHTKNDPHQLTLARLDWELEQRKRLAEKYKESQATKEKIQKSIEVKKEHLRSLQPGLNAIMQASLPVQEYLSMPFEQTQKQTEIARHLPPPLYVLFVQANAYGQACDKNLTMSISGDVDEAKALSKPPEDSQDDESDSDAEEEQEKTKRRRPTTGGQLDDKRREMLKRHPLSLCLDLKCKDGSILHLYFYYLMNLNIMTVKTKVSTSTDLTTAISAGELLKSDTLLSCLYTSDQGRETPNPANRYQFDKVGIVTFADYVEELGHPYMWVQSLGGLHFPSDASEGVRVGSSLSASHMESTMKLLRGRVQSRLALHKQFASLEHSIIPVSSECQQLFPAKIISRLARWTTISHQEYLDLPYTRHVTEAGLAKESDLYFMGVVERGTEISPLFSLSLSWKGERSGRTDDNLRAMESEVNVFKNELQGPRPGHQLLTNQIARLCVCLDVYLETEGQDDSVEGPREFPREKMCLRTVRGPNRLKPFKYNHPQGFFSHLPVWAAGYFQPLCPALPSLAHSSLASPPLQPWNRAPQAYFLAFSSLLSFASVPEDFSTFSAFPPSFTSLLSSLLVSFFSSGFFTSVLLSVFSGSALGAGFSSGFFSSFLLSVFSGSALAAGFGSGSVFSGLGAAGFSSFAGGALSLASGLAAGLSSAGLLGGAGFEASSFFGASSALLSFFVSGLSAFSALLSGSFSLGSSFFSSFTGCSFSFFSSLTG